MKMVYEAADLREAEEIKEFLRQRGIASHVFGAYTFNLPGANPLGFPSLWIEEAAYFERTKKLLVEFKQARRQEKRKPAWVCRQCGERHGGQFSECWKCGGSNENDME